VGTFTHLSFVIVLFFALATLPDLEFRQSSPVRAQTVSFTQSATSLMRVKMLGYLSSAQVLAQLAIPT
jgi:hypothetical protein